MGKKSATSTLFGPVVPHATTVAPTSQKNTSSILKSAFAPSPLQLQLFASVIQSFESQQIRIHDTSSGRLRQQHTTSPGIRVCSLDWGCYGASYRESQTSGRKKRKRVQNAPEDIVLAYGTSTSEICMYSPTEDRITGKLSGGHENGIRDFKFNTSDYLEAWSLGGDARLVQWDLKSDTVVRSITLPDPSMAVLSQPSLQDPKIMCGSVTPYCISVMTPEDHRLDAYDSFQYPIHTILRSQLNAETVDETFLAVDQDRYMNVFDIQQKKLVRTLVAGSGIQSANLYTPLPADDMIQQQMLVIVNQEGSVELFARPFWQPDAVGGDLKSKRKNMTRKANAQIKLLRSNTTELVQIFAASFNGPDIVLVSVEGGVEPLFQKVRWQDEATGDLLLEGVREIHQTKKSSALNSVTLNGVKDMGKTHVDESKTVVLNGAHHLGSQEAAIEITSTDDDQDESDSEAIDEENTTDALGRKADSEDESDDVMEDAQALGDEDSSDGEDDVEGNPKMGENGELSFGDMLAMRHPETISIGDALLDPRQSNDMTSMQQLSVPSGMSLGTVLTQALKTNDNNLLESCLHANDPGIIQNTIQRLESRLASNLLSKLAERLASRPGRYGHLISWVQWTCIAHGGALAGQPDVAAKIRTLYNVLNQRSSSLDKLLLLKGKLDMLEAQLRFRKQLQAQRDLARATDEEGMIYIEGDEDNWSSGDDLDEAVGVPQKLGFKTKVPLRKGLVDLAEEASSEEDEIDEMPTTNGIGSGDDDDEDEDSDSEIDADGRRRKGLVDVEAEEAGEVEVSSSYDSDDDRPSASDAEEDIGDEDEDEEDSSMADFINDGAISEVEEDDIDADIDEEETAKRPATKRSKHKH